MATELHACTHCGGKAHFVHEISAAGGMGPTLLPLGFVGWAEGARYRLRVCGRCGLTQWFVPDAFLTLVRERFARETP